MDITTQKRNAKKFAEYLEVSESMIKNIEAGTIKAPANLISKIVNITK